MTRSTDPTGKMVPDRRLEVTVDDIEAGERRDQWNCAIAESIKRNIPEASRVRVNRRTISFTSGEERITYPTPEAAVEAIIKPYDEEVPGIEPEPILLHLKGGVANPRTHRPDEENIKRRKGIRKYAKAVRTGERPTPPSTKVRQGEETPSSRSWNRFLDQSRATERGIG